MIAGPRDRSLGLRTLIWRALVLAVMVLIVRPVAAHPKPGAHADVRISIEPEAVRFEVLMNILFADQIVNVQRVARDNVTEAEVEPLRQALAEYFGAARGAAVTALVDRGNRVLVDGVEVAPVIDTLRVVYPEPERRPGFIQNPALLLPQILVVARYPCTTSPKRVGLVWGSYPRDFIAPERDTAPITDIEAVLTFGAALELVKFTKAEPEYVWHAPADGGRRNFAAVPTPVDVSSRTRGWPVGTAVCALAWSVFVGVLAARRGGRVPMKPVAAGAVLCGVAGLIAWPIDALRVTVERESPRLSDAAALEVFMPLHANIYRAFDYARESDVYDALARSVDGALLDAVYNDVYTGLILREEGGALCRVRAVTPLESRVLPPEKDAASAGADRFVVWCRWRVEGVVYHWGHSHTRVNEYVAEYDVALSEQQKEGGGRSGGESGGGWRIVGLRPLEQRRIESAAQAASPAAVGKGGGEGGGGQVVPASGTIVPPSTITEPKAPGP